MISKMNSFTYIVQNVILLAYFIHSPSQKSANHILERNLIEVYELLDYKPQDFRHFFSRDKGFLKCTIVNRAFKATPLGG